VASLLGQKSGDSISAYERGIRSPDLATALKLAIIYDRSVEELFPEHCAVFKNELSARISRIPRPITQLRTVNEEAEPRLECGYERLMAEPAHRPPSMHIIRDHVTKLAKHLAGL
jgi:transcriptional regulator with XRE-family HTH domain